MTNQIRITVEHIVDNKIRDSNIISEKEVAKVNCISKLGFSHKEQINILQGCQ